jgi:hypothetical protein
MSISTSKDFRPQTGMVFETDGGKWGFFIEVKGWVYRVYYGEKDSMQHGNCQLTGNHLPIKKDIAIIYAGMTRDGCDSAMPILRNSINNPHWHGEVVWKRRQVVKVTKKEIAEKFGVEVENLEIVL